MLTHCRTAAMSVRVSSLELLLWPPRIDTVSVAAALGRRTGEGGCIIGRSKGKKVGDYGNEKLDRRLIFANRK